MYAKSIIREECTPLQVNMPTIAVEDSDQDGMLTDSSSEITTDRHARIASKRKKYQRLNKYISAKGTKLQHVYHTPTLFTHNYVDTHKPVHMTPPSGDEFE